MSPADLAERLDQALDAVLTVRVALAAGAGPALPDEALDAALALSEGFQAARRDFVSALEFAQRLGVADDAIFAVEAAAHAMVAEAAEATWGLARRLQHSKP